QAVADAKGGVHQLHAIGVGHRLGAAEDGQRLVLELGQGAHVALPFQLVEHQHAGAGEQEQAEQAQQLDADAERGGLARHRRRPQGCACRQRVMASGSCSPGTGAEIRYPWAMSQPSWASNCHSSSVSTPSATTSSDSLRARSRLVSIMARLRGWVVAPETKPRSIFSSVKGICESCESEE